MACTRTSDKASIFLWVTVSCIWACFIGTKKVLCHKLHPPACISLFALSNAKLRSLTVIVLSFFNFKTRRGAGAAMHAGLHMCYSACVEVRGQLWGVISLFPYLYVFWGLNWDCQAVKQVCYPMSHLSIPKTHKIFFSQIRILCWLSHHTEDSFLLILLILKNQLSFLRIFNLKAI